MPDGLAVMPEVSGTYALRKAHSACCQAPLNRVAPGVESFTCRECDRPTERVLSDPEEVHFRG
jgi:hypothetical protein